jgi:hypothetical protein
MTCMPYACYADVNYCEYSVRGNKAILEHAYVDEAGNPTQRFYSESFDLPPGFAEVAWYDCKSCGQMFGDHEWRAVLEHFPAEELEDDKDDEEDEF